MSKFLILLTELLVFWGEVSSMINKRKCRPLYADQDAQEMAEKSEPFSIVCKARTDDNCTTEMITAELYRNDKLLGQMSENRREIEYEYKISSIKMSDAGFYLCSVKNKYGTLNYTVTVNISDNHQSSDRFLPHDKDQINQDQLYLHSNMKNTVKVKHLGRGSACHFECTFYCPQRNVSISTYWIQHTTEDYKSGTRLSSNEKFNISRSNHCNNTGDLDSKYIKSKLELIDVSDNALFTCLIEAENETLRNVHFSFSLLVDATTNNQGNNKFLNPQIEFTNNSSVCLGQNFTFYCAVEDPSLNIYLYKIHPSLDLSKLVINLNTSVLLKMYIGNGNYDLLSEQDMMLLNDNVEIPYINYTLTSVSSNDSGRYICIMDNSLPLETPKLKTMYLSTSYCNFYGKRFEIMFKYLIYGISIPLVFFLVIFICLMLFLKRKNDRFKKFALRKIIIVEYESPIYKSIFHSSKTCKSERLNSKIYLPDSDPIIAPIIKIKPIKGSSNRFRGRSYGEELPSTSTYRTRLESAQLSSQLDNDVFESNHSDYQSKFKSDLEKSSSIIFDSFYEFPHDYRWEFPREKLKVTSRKLGEGAFGMVYEGLATDICDRSGLTRVGVKMMKDDFSDTNVLDFMKEIETMKQIGVHRHVIQLLGICTQHGPLHVIVEFAPHGNLRDYIRSKCFKSKKSTKYQSTLSSSNLCTYALQIAHGMTYLSSRSVVHRDLSARNILVGENYDMKIADFGLTRIVDYYYRKKSDGILPIKWMAPEALLQKKYTTKSDVWSYGILLWEIFSLGDSPYASALPENIITLIQRGVQNPKPIMANLDIYQLMQQCWHLLHENRPHFYQIVEIWKEIISRVDDEPEPNIYHSETVYLELDSGYLEPKGSLP